MSVEVTSQYDFNFSFLRDSSPKNENSVINYSLSCRSKPIRLQNTNEDIFAEIRELSDPA